MIGERILTKQQLIDLLSNSDLNYLKQTVLVLCQGKNGKFKIKRMEDGENLTIFDSDELNQKWIYDNIT